MSVYYATQYPFIHLIKRYIMSEKHATQYHFIYKQYHFMIVFKQCTCKSNQLCMNSSLEDQSNHVCANNSEAITCRLWRFVYHLNPWHLAFIEIKDRERHNLSNLDIEMRPSLGNAYNTIISIEGFIIK